MSNLTITDNDLGSVILKEGQFRRELLALAAADVILEGTLLARRVVATAIVVADVGTPTGNGTVDTATVVGGKVVPLVGAYVLECVEVVTHGGIFTLTDPNGALVATDLRLTEGAGVATTFIVGGLTFKITDGSTDFAAGDGYTLTVAADGDLVPFAVAGVGGAQIPIAILTYELTVTASGDFAIRSMVSGSVRKERLVIDGTAAGVGITDAIIDQLRNFSIVPIDVAELNIEDND
jgi:hypothetical protein